MATYSEKINTYRVILFGKGNSARMDYIYCRCTNDRNVYLYFYDDDGTIPVNSYSHGVTRINYPKSKFNWILDILRNEEPVYYYYNTSSNIGYLRTFDEPVGEEES